MKSIFIIVLLIQFGCNNSTSDSDKNYYQLTNNSNPDCEWCGADEAPSDISWKTTIVPDDEPGKRITISGVVYKNDKKTPAENIIIYVYNTNEKGIYPKNGNETGNGKRHGYIRGWMKTSKDGKYAFTTLKPGPYPGADNPAHIHITAKEPGKEEYWLDEFLFIDDAVYLKELKNKNQPLPLEDAFNHVLFPKEDASGNFTAIRNLILK